MCMSLMQVRFSDQYLRFNQKHHLQLFSCQLERMATNECRSLPTLAES
jgi:hypothetical protein